MQPLKVKIFVTMENTETETLALIDEKIKLGRSLVGKLEQGFSDVDGALKTKRIIDKEIKFLQKVRIFKAVYSLFIAQFSFS